MSDQPMKRPEPFTFVRLDGEPNIEGYIIEEANAVFTTLETRCAELEAENKGLRSAMLKAYGALRRLGDHDISTDLYDALKDTP